MKLNRLLALLLLTAVGCAQNQIPEFGQQESQRTDNIQDTATMGGDTSYVIFLQDPQANDAQELLGAMQLSSVGGDEQVQAIINRLTSSGESNDLSDGQAGHIQGGITVHVTMGSGTTPTVTGTATGSQAATGTQKSDATQKPKADVSVSLPVAVGAMPHATSNLADRGSTANQEVSASQELRQALLRAQGELGDEGLQKLLADLFSGGNDQKPKDDSGDG